MLPTPIGRPGPAISERRGADMGGCHVDLTSAYLPPVLLGAPLAAGALRCRIQTERSPEHRDVAQRHREADVGHPGGTP